MNDTIPAYMNPSEAVRAYQTEQAGQGAAAKLRELAKQGLVQEAPDLGGFRTFLSPVHKNGRFLVSYGRYVTAPPHPGNPMGIVPLVAREGDIWARFNNGVLSTDDPDIIAWLVAHSGDSQEHADYHNSGAGVPLKDCTTPISLCMEQGPGIDVWAELVMGQHPTARRPATISPEIDISGYMRLNAAARMQHATLKTGDGARMTEVAENNAAARIKRARGNVVR